MSGRRRRSQDSPPRLAATSAVPRAARATLSSQGRPLDQDDGAHRQQQGGGEGEHDGAEQQTDPRRHAGDLRLGLVLGDHQVGGEEAAGRAGEAPEQPEPGSQGQGAPAALAVGR